MFIERNTKLFVNYNNYCRVVVQMCWRFYRTRRVGLFQSFASESFIRVLGFGCWKKIRIIRLAFRVEKKLILIINSKIWKKKIIHELY